jgi:hypothetical protein
MIETVLRSARPVLVLCLVLVACGPTATEFISPQASPEATERPGPASLETGAEESASDPRVKALVDEAKRSLSERLGIPVAEISEESVEEVEWRDSSLGCPQSGSASLTVITPGFLIILSAEGKKYEYHADHKRVVTCDNPQPPYRSEPALGPEAALVADAKADLAQRKGVGEDEIAVVSVEATKWPDASLGCPEEGMMYAQVITPGYQILLSAEGETYDYRTDMHRVRLCESEGDLDNELVAAAVADLAEELGVPDDEIDVVSVEEMDWPDSSWGCPEEGMMYLQVVTPGYQIILSAEGETYDYRADMTDVRLCKLAMDPEEKMIGASVADLAQRLDVSADEVEVVSVEATEWPDASLGCPEEGMMYAQVITRGYRIILAAGGETYDYRTDMSNVRLCEQ